MLKLSELKEGKWLLLRNGRRVEVVGISQYRDNDEEYHVCIQSKKGWKRHVIYEEYAGFLKAFHRSTLDALAVYNTRPTKVDIIKRIKQHSIIRFRNGRRIAVKEFRRSDIPYYAYYVRFLDTHDGEIDEIRIFANGRTIAGEKFEYDIVAVEN